MSSLLSLIRNNRLGRKLKLVSSAENNRAGETGVFAELPIAKYSSDSEIIEEGFVRLSADSTVSPHRGHHAIVVVNNELNKYGITSTQTLISPEDGEFPLTVSLDVKRPIDLSKIEWLVRVYLID